MQGLLSCSSVGSPLSNHPQNPHYPPAITFAGFPRSSPRAVSSQALVLACFHTRLEISRETGYQIPIALQPNHKQRGAIPRAGEDIWEPGEG